MSQIHMGFLDGTELGKDYFTYDPNGDLVYRKMELSYYTEKEVTEYNYEYSGNRIKANYHLIPYADGIKPDGVNTDINITWLDVFSEIEIILDNAGYALKGTENITYDSEYVELVEPMWSRFELSTELENDRLVKLSYHIINSDSKDQTGDDYTGEDFYEWTDGNLTRGISRGNYISELEYYEDIPNKNNVNFDMNWCFYYDNSYSLRDIGYGLWQLGFAGLRSEKMVKNIKVYDPAGKLYFESDYEYQLDPEGFVEKCYLYCSDGPDWVYTIFYEE